MALFLLRCKEVGLSIGELDSLPYFLVLQILLEKIKDQETEPEEDTYYLPSEEDY